jgi:hypothetical protein
MDKIQQFFARYEEGANTFDADLVCSLYTQEFMGADPGGVVCGRNDEGFRDVISARKAFFQQIGFRNAKVLDVKATALDDHYTMAKVYWHMLFEKDPGQPLN